MLAQAFFARDKFMHIRPNLSSVIGNTPLIRLHRISALTGCEVLAKAEFLNPGGSIKDRTALGLTLDAERDGALRSRSATIEGIAGNTV